MVAKSRQRHVQVDFYKPHFLTGEGDFSQLLIAVADKPDDGTRTENIDEDPIRLVNLTRMDGGAIVVDFVKIKMDEDALVARASGGYPTMLQLEEDQGVASQTSILFDPRLNIAAIQRVRRGVSGAKIGKYIQLQTGTTPINLQPVLTQEAIQKLARMTSFSRFEFSIARLENLEAFKSSDCGPEEVANLQKAFKAPRVRVALSVGRSPSATLEAGIVRKTIERIQQVVGLGGRATMEVKGTLEDGNLEILKLTDLLMTERVAREVDGTTRGLSTAAVRSALHECWNRRKDELSRMHGAGVEVR